jgi:hypothetical protein
VAKFRAEDGHHMSNPYKASALLVGCVAAVGLCFTTGATTIFDNSQNDLLYRFNPGTVEVGDEIILASTERYLTQFSFEFWGTNTASPGNTTFAGAVEARVRFYKNDGTPFNGYATPSSSFFDSGWFSLGTPTARSTVEFNQGADFPDGGLFIPVSDMTWSVEFQGMGATDSVGVDIYSPPVTGADYPDYWENSAGWKLLTNGVPMNFAARMEANSTVPEPSTAALAMMGGLAVLGMARRLRWKS